jgi:hypothetical protein
VATASGNDKAAAKEKRQATKAAKHEAKRTGQGPAPSEPPAEQQPSTSGTNPAGNEKDHGRWARTQRSTAPVVTPASSATPDAPTPMDQGQPAAVPDTAKGNGNANGDGKDK